MKKVEYYNLLRDDFILSPNDSVRTRDLFAVLRRHPTLKDKPDNTLSHILTSLGFPATTELTKDPKCPYHRKGLRNLH